MKLLLLLSAALLSACSEATPNKAEDRAVKTEGLKNVQSNKAEMRKAVLKQSRGTPETTIDNDPRNWRDIPYPLLRDWLPKHGYKLVIDGVLCGERDDIGVDTFTCAKLATSENSMPCDESSGCLYRYSMKSSFDGALMYADIVTSGPKGNVLQVGTFDQADANR